MQSLPRFRAIHQVRTPRGGIVEAYGTVMVEGDRYWFHPDGTSAAYGYWVPRNETILAGQLAPERIPVCECREDYVCPSCYDSVQFA